MKKIFVLILGLILWTSCNNETREVEYGSNNGRLISINDKKIYYEEYGQGLPYYCFQVVGLIGV